MSTESHTAELEVLQAVIDSLAKLDDDAKGRVLQYASTLFRLAPPSTATMPTPVTSANGNGERAFSDRKDLSPKEFLLEKEPNTDVERVTCLAFYLTHYRNTPHFKTIDISTINTEAAQPKFSNAAYAVENATAAGLLVPAQKGMKQLSAVGERFVQALPDRTAAQAIRERHAKRTRRAGKSQSSSADTEE